MVKKNIPDHIYPLYDEEIKQWGIWNSRLNQWVGKDEHWGHAAFGSAQDAANWFYDQF